MAKSVLNDVILMSFANLKRDVVKNGGSLFCIVVNDGELLQSGGGNAELMQHYLKQAIEQIDKDKTIIIQPRGLT